MTMLLGERAVLHVPSQLAFRQGNGLLPPNTDVDIDVELIGINGRLSPEYADARKCTVQ